MESTPPNPNSYQTPLSTFPYPSLHQLTPEQAKSIINSNSEIVEFNLYNSQLITSLSYSHYKLKNFHRSFFCAKIALETIQGPPLGELWYIIGRIQSIKGFSTKAISSLSNSILNSPPFPILAKAEYYLGVEFKKQSEFQEALLHLQQSEDLFEKDPYRRMKAIIEQGICYGLRQEENEAVLFYQKAVRTEQRAESVGALVWGLLQEKEAEKALEILESSSFDQEFIIYLRSLALMEIEKYEESCRILKELLYRNSDFYYYWFSIGVLYWRNEEALEAFEALMKSVLLDKEKVEGLYYLGVVYESCNEKKEAEMCYEKVKNLGCEFVEEEIEGLYERNETRFSLPLWDFSEILFPEKFKKTEVSEAERFEYGFDGQELDLVSRNFENFSINEDSF